MDNAKRKVIIQQIKDAKRTGDTEWVKELEQELEDDLKLEEPENLKAYMSLASDDDPIWDKLMAISHKVSKGHASNENSVIVFSDDVSLLALIAAFGAGGIHFTANKKGQVVKHGADTVLIGSIASGETLSFQIDARGFVDAVHFDGHEGAEIDRD